jgi:hypothetical protein
VDKAQFRESALANRETVLASAVLAAQCLQPYAESLSLAWVLCRLPAKLTRRSAPQDAAIVDGFEQLVHQPAQMNST